LRKAEQDIQSTYIHVTMRRVRVTTIAVEKYEILRVLRVCSISYTPCNTYAPYYIAISGLRFWHSLPHNLIKGTISEERKKKIYIYIYTHRECQKNVHIFYIDNIS